MKLLKSNNKRMTMAKSVGSFSNASKGHKESIRRGNGNRQSTVSSRWASHYAHPSKSPITPSSEFSLSLFLMTMLVQLKVEHFWICLSFLLWKSDKCLLTGLRVLLFSGLDNLKRYSEPRFVLFSNVAGVFHCTMLLHPPFISRPVLLHLLDVDFAEIYVLMMPPSADISC
jgi:hypothetical protein